MNDKPLRNTKRRLAEGLMSWLTFEFACSRGYLFSEYYLAHAVGQLLRAGGTKVRGEVPHPTLAVEGRVGRPPSLDFVVYGTGDVPLLNVETKWAGYTEVTAGALIWDAFRLAAAGQASGAPGLLVLGGTLKNLDKLFDSQAFKRPASTPNAGRLLLPKESGEYRFVLKRDELSPAAAKYVASKVATCPDGAIPDRVRFELPHVARSQGAVSISFGVYVWEIHPKR